MCLAEWLIVAGVITVIASVVGSVLAMSSRQARMAMVRADFDMVLEASNRFFAEYEHWPTAFLNDYGDTWYGTELRSNAEVINVLRAVSGPGNQGHRVNPNRIVYVDMADYAPGFSGLNGRGAFLDPWGTQYQIVIDTDVNGNCTVERSVHGFVEDEPVLVWTCGPDGRTDTQDDIVSWRRKER